MNDTPTLKTIEQRVRIAASAETIWTFWTDAEKLCEWWGVTAEADAEPGGVVRVTMSPGGPVMSGRYVELEPFTRLVFTFGWEGNPMGEALAPGSTIVEVTLTPVGRDTELMLRHSEVPAAFSDEHAKGWALFVGERLADVAARNAV